MRLLLTFTSEAATPVYLVHQHVVAVDISQKLLNQYIFVLCSISSYGLNSIQNYYLCTAPPLPHFPFSWQHFPAFFQHFPAFLQSFPALPSVFPAVFQEFEQFPIIIFQHLLGNWIICHQISNVWSRFASSFQQFP